MLHDRLWDAGVNNLLWDSQFGFRPTYSTCDALFVAIGRIEAAVAQQGGRILLWALAWGRAFDGVNLDALLDALWRVLAFHQHFVA